MKAKDAIEKYNIVAQRYISAYCPVTASDIGCLLINSYDCKRLALVIYRVSNINQYNLNYYSHCHLHQLSFNMKI